MKDENNSGVLNKDEEEELRLFGYAYSLPRKIFFYLLIILSGGIVLLFAYWKPHLRLSLMARKCGLRSADLIIVYVSP